MEPHEFTAEIWEADAMAAWAFVTLPRAAADEIRFAAGPPRGFGSVRVEVTAGATTWRTSVFPDKASGSFVLPLKKAVRRSEGLEIGDDVTIALVVLEE